MSFDQDTARRRLAGIVEARRAQWLAEARTLAAVADFGDAYRELPSDSPEVLEGTERLVSWGGPGVPEVAEFCCLEYAAATRTTVDEARASIGQAMGLKYRSPGLWNLVMAGRVRVWHATAIARLAGQLPLEQAQLLDTEICERIESWSRKRLEEWVKARVIELDPAQAQTDHERARASRRVDFDQSHLGVTGMSATLDAADAVFLKAQINRIADVLDQAGSTEPADVRRATALGVLATPARALQLLQASLLDQLPDLDLDPECPAQGQRGHTCGKITVHPDQLLPRAQVVVHLTDQTAHTGSGMVRGEQTGPLLAGWVKDLLGHTRVTMRPVLDADGLVASDAYECPDRMREAVELRNPYEVFPYSNRRSRGLDMDHTQPWTPRHQRAAGELPPTRLGNLGPLSRLVHRAKTHGGWKLKQPTPGVFHWQSPLGYQYAVNRTATVVAGGRDFVGISRTTGNQAPRSEADKLDGSSPEVRDLTNPPPTPVGVGGWLARSAVAPELTAAGPEPPLPITP